MPSSDFELGKILQLGAENRLLLNAFYLVFLTRELQIENNRKIASTEPTRGQNGGEDGSIRLYDG